MQHVLIIGGSRASRRRVALVRQQSRRPAALIALDAATLPFLRIDKSQLPVAHPRLVRVDDIERSFPDNQTAGTRLILTQSTYLLQRWVDALDPDDLIIATADRIALEGRAKDAFIARGPWRSFDIVDLGKEDAEEKEHAQEQADAEGSEDGDGREDVEGAEGAQSTNRGVSLAVRLLARAFGSTSPAERLRLCREAQQVAPESAVGVLALASACREQQDLAGARGALDQAALLAPEWEAVHYESGKFWLGCDDLERAREGFERAAELMPAFSAAWSNLGAVLGELDRSEEALAAFGHALENEPDSFTVLNNVGVATRELGRLQESEHALRRVVQVAPAFAFGHYNLGHTLLLAGKWTEALAAYEEGQRRDPEKNRRQGCRLAIARLANGDVEGAERDLWRFADAAPPEERQDVLLEAYEIGEAVIRARQNSRGRALLDRIAAEITRRGL